MELIEAKNLTCTYPASPEPSIQNLSFTLKKKEIMTVIGSNGSGKSTLCRLLSGFFHTHYQGTLSGSLKIMGKDIKEFRASDKAPLLAYLPQEPGNLLSGFKETLYDELIFGMENFGIEIDEMKTRAEWVLKQLRLKKLAFRDPKTLSGGELQRSALALILVMKPQILLLDDPFAQLNQNGAEEIWNVLNELKQENIGILLTTMNGTFALAGSNSILVLHEGKAMAGNDRKNIMKEIVPTPLTESIHEIRSRAGFLPEKTPDENYDDCYEFLKRGLS